VTSSLRHALVAAAEQLGSMNAATVLANGNDPFRVDTPANHRDGAWLADTAAELGLGLRIIHLRGLHYMVIGWPKPNGKPYTNTDADWNWLSGRAGKAARWLGYLPWERVVDQRNAEPVIYLHEQVDPTPYLHVGLDVHVPDIDDLQPEVGVGGFDGRQPYKLVLFGEKSSLEPVLKPIAATYKADLYLPTGEISDTLMHTMAKTGADDGRPMIVFTFSDADPSGWQMPVSIGRKLQAFRTSLYPDLTFEVRRVGLTPEQVIDYGLPSTPLKETERRAGAWKDAMHVEQTEIDALAALQPELLATMARDALDGFFDHTLDLRVVEAKGRWLDQAQQVVDDSVDAELMGLVHADAEAKLDQLRAELDQINRTLQLSVGDGFDLPPIVIPEPAVTPPSTPPLVSSRWPFVQQTQALIDSKAYDLGGAA
jgi:hypothetical protein